MLQINSHFRSNNDSQGNISLILFGAHELTKSFESKALFDGLTFSVESSEKIALIGPNGAGKSTLLKIIAGIEKPDAGRLALQKGLRIGYLEQVPQFKEGSNLFQVIMEGAADPDDWEATAKAQELMTKLSLNQFEPDILIKNLSGGWKKRVALAREMMKDPDLFLFDEPTNHLDIESILWLEKQISEANFASITISHDRLFIQKIANRVIELNRKYSDGILSVKGDYAHFLTVQEDLLSAQETRETKLKNTLRRETEWLRRGAKARQTKQKARINETHRLADTVDDLSERNRNQAVRIDFQTLEKNPKKLIEAKGISKSYNGNLIIPQMDLLISRTSRIGLMGVNGSGKSTLIKILNKTVEPDTGTVFHAERLNLTYFEQNRDSLDPELSVQKTICPVGDTVVFQGVNVHIKSYLARFLFRHEQMEAPVRKLSGGEQSRLLLAQLMLQETNLLVLDEPTNDLDMQTLDTLAEVLKDFNGAIILVTHDRYFLDQVTDQILAFGIDEQGGKQIDTMVGFDQWQDWHDQQQIFQDKLKQNKKNPKNSDSKSESSKKQKLSFKEQTELDGIEAVIQKTEKELEHLVNQSQSSEVVSDSRKLTEVMQEISNHQSQIDKLYQRWEELSQKAK
jgi:ATP-binding cassette subfamily F protein uup